jgi:hypothetical protein
MTVSAQEQRILARVLEMLGSGKALAQDLEDYVVGFAVLGRLVSIQQGIVETQEQDRKVEWAKEFTKAKTGEERVSDKVAEAAADVAVDSLRRKEIASREKLTLLRSTKDSVQEAIWAIKNLNSRGG